MFCGSVVLDVSALSNIGDVGFTSPDHGGGFLRENCLPAFQTTSGIISGTSRSRIKFYHEMNQITNIAVKNKPAQ